MLEHMVRERTAELVAANHELSQSALRSTRARGAFKRRSSRRHWHGDRRP